MNGKKIVGWLVRISPEAAGRAAKRALAGCGIAAEGCSSMGAGSIGGKNYCGNLLWQSSLV